MNSFKPAIYLSSIVVSIILIIYGIYVFPIPGTDSMVFLPGALRYAQGKGLTNPLYYVTNFTDPTHSSKFNYYVPFYPMFLGWLSRVRPDIRTITFICGIFSVTGLLLYGRVIGSFFPENSPKWLKATVLLSFTFLATYLLPTVGRPENFTCLFVFLIFILFRKRKNINGVLLFVLLAMLFSLVFATQIIGFFFSFLFFALCDLLHATNIFKNILKNFLLFVSIVGGFCGILALSPNGVSETIQAIGWHIALALSRADNPIRTLIYYWVYAPLSFGFVAIFALAATFFALDVNEKLKGQPIIKIILAVILLLLITFGLFNYVLIAAPTVYNATQFILPLMTYIIYNISITRAPILRKAAVGLLLLTCIGGSFIFLRGLILFGDSLYTGKDFASARAVVEKYTKNNQKVVTSNGIWCLFNDLDNPKTTITDQFESGDTIVMQQAYYSFPRFITDRCTVLFDWRAPEPVTFMGIKIANHPYGYGLVIFKAK
jgi:hypothetical protein